MAEPANLFFLGPSRSHARRMVELLRLYDAMVQAGRPLPVPSLVPEAKYPARGDQEFHTLQHTMVTKYYVASLKLWVQAWDGAPSSDARSFLERERAEAACFCVDGSDPDSFAELEAHWGPSLAGDDAHGCQLVLFANAAGVADKVKQQWMSWCVERRCELVEVDFENAIAGHALREKEGFPRVVEALQANMWSSMMRIEQHAEPKSETLLLGSRDPPVAAAEVGLQGGEKGHATGSTTSLRADEKSGAERTEANHLAEKSAAPYTPPALRLSVQEHVEEGYVQGGDASAGAQLAKETVAPSGLIADQGIDAPGERPGARSDEAGGSETIGIGELEGMLLRAREVRQTAASMPDDMRRDRAAEMAMKLMSLLGGAEDDEEGEDPLE